MFDKLFNRKKEPPPLQKDDWAEKLIWLPVGHAGNPFQQEVLDCRAVALTFASYTTNKDIAENFNRLRASNGQELRGQFPEKSMVANCDLRFPYNGRRSEGPISIAREMEDKWDFYAYDDQLFIRRSWTGKLVHTAELQYSGDEVIIHRIHSESSMVSGSDVFAIAEVYFLIITHFGKSIIPFPIPGNFTRSEIGSIATAGFNSYGRRAQFGAYTKSAGV